MKTIFYGGDVLDSGCHYFITITIKTGKVIPVVKKDKGTYENTAGNSYLRICP